jgi:hypothetical protein
LQHQPQIEQRPDVIRFIDQRPRIGGRRLRQFALRLERIAQVVMKSRDLAILRNGSTDQIYRKIIAADLVSEHAEKMQRIRMVGIDLQNLEIKPFRFAQTPGLMMAHRGGECCLNARR